MTFFQRIKTPFTENPDDEQVRLQPQMRRVGELLQERREELGLDLDEIGEMLRIKPGYLAALEQGRTHDLPGPAYAIGFVRAYAEFLGMAAEPVLARFKAEASGVTARPDLALPVPLGERSLPGGALVLVALILALCGYGIWYYLSTDDRHRPERVASVPASLEVPATVPGRAAASPAPAAGGVPNSENNPQASPSTPFGVAANSSPAPTGAASPSPLATPAPQSHAATAASVMQPNPAPGSLSPGALISALPRNTPTASQPAAAAASPAAPPAVSSQPAFPATPVPQATQTAAVAPHAAISGADNAPTARVAIRALADCWIQVRAPDQSIVFSRVLKSGEVYNVPNRAGLSLRTGNAGVLEIAVDGKTVPSIGGIGALRRDVVLDPAELAAGTAVHG